MLGVVLLACQEPCSPARVGIRAADPRWYPKLRRHHKHRASVPPPWPATSFFAACGVLSASWPARIPQLRDHLHLQPSTLGWVLLAAAVGSFASRPLSAPIVARLGQRSTATAAAILAGLGL